MGSDILSREYAPSSGARSAFTHPPIPIGQDRLTEAGHSVDGGIFQALHGVVLLSCEYAPSSGARSAFARPPGTPIPFGQDRLTETGHSVRQRYFPSTTRVSPLNVLSHSRTLLQLMANSLAVLWTLASFLHCRSTTETLQCRSFNEELPEDHVAGHIWLGGLCTR